MVPGGSGNSLLLEVKNLMSELRRRKIETIEANKHKMLLNSMSVF